MTEHSLTDTRPPVVGFVGLGEQGGPMAANLAAALDAMVAGQRFGIDVETMLE